MVKKESRNSLFKKKKKTVRPKPKLSKKEKARRQAAKLAAETRKLKAQLKRARRELALKKAAETRRRKAVELRRSLRRIWEVEHRAKVQALKAKAKIYEQELRLYREREKLKEIEKKRLTGREREHNKIHYVEMDTDTPTILLNNILEKIKKFNTKHSFDATVDGSVQSDLSVIIDMEYFDMHRMQDILAYLSEEIQSYGPTFKVCIAPIFDTSKIVKPIEFVGEDSIVAGGSAINIYKGKSMLPTNASRDVAGLFANFEFDILEKMTDFTGIKPDSLRVVLLYGDTIMNQKISRNWAASEHRSPLEIE